jgi:hypothetical protein
MNQEQIRLQTLLTAARNRLTAEEATPEPSIALYRAQRRQRLSRHRLQIKQLEEALRAAGDV